MKLYLGKRTAEMKEGIIHGIDDNDYQSLYEAQEDYKDDDGVFAFYDEQGNIKVAWS